MSKRSTKFKRKVRTCRNVARTGGIIAAASMALVSKGYGIGIRYKVNDHIPPNSEKQGYDIDQDGDLDVFFDTIGMSMEAERRSFGGGEVTCHIFVIPDINFFGAKAYLFDELIGSFDPAISEDTNASLMTSSFDDSPFYNQPTPRYAGFTFVVSDSVPHFGWAELRVTGSTNDGFGLDVIAFGYETEPLTLIQAGQPLIPVPTESSSWGRIKALYSK